MCDKTCSNYIHVRENFVLLAWKEAWFLLLPKIDDDHMVTWRNLMEY